MLTDNLTMWNLITGFLSATVVLPIIQQPRWSTNTRAVITFVYSIVVGLVTAYFTGAFNSVHDAQTGITSVLLTLVAVISSYKGFAKPTGIAPTIESATSPGPALPAGGE